MFKFIKKDKMSEEEKEMLRRLSLFYEMNKNIFVETESVQEKREIIKKIYNLIGYDKFPKLYSDSKDIENNELKVYRGISAKDIELLKQYTNDFIKGEIFYGGRASIYGLGIYTSIGTDSNIAKDYASDGGINECGVVIESKMQSDTKIIKNSDLEIIKKIMFDRMRKIYKSNIENYLNILENDGALAAILGYDAIFVEEKKYLVVLNRTKMIVNDIDLYEQIETINEKNKKSY